MAAPAASSASAGAKRAHSGAAAERRVQPRHFHFGPNPAAIDDDGGADGQAAAAATSPPSPVQLYRDAVGCVFAFLRRGELATALQVSRGWLAAANSMRSLQLEICPGEVPVFVLAQSAMGRHVAALGFHGARASLSAESLYVLALKMPQLRELVCTLLLPPVPAPLFFPAALRKLDLRFDAHDGRTADVNAALQSVGRLPLLEFFVIELHAIDPRISFARLAALPLLSRLSIFGYSGRGELSDAQVDQLRALPQLRELAVHMTPLLLRRLLRQPHDLQWQRIPLPYPLDAEFAALLPQLPSLTAIDCHTACSRFDWLRGLPNLADVDFEFIHAEGAGHKNRAASLVAGLQSCANVEKLSISDGDHLTAAHLADLLPRLPRLRELTLTGLNIDSLSFLAQPPMTDQLATFGLWDCIRLPLTELRHVHALRGLQSLWLEESFNELMDSHCQSLYTRPSLLLPQLRKFYYSPPADDE